MQEVSVESREMYEQLLQSRHITRGSRRGFQDVVNIFELASAHNCTAPNRYACLILLYPTTTPRFGYCCRKFWISVYNSVSDSCTHSPDADSRVQLAAACKMVCLITRAVS